MPNWKNFRRLLNHMKSTEETATRKFDMNDYIQILSGDPMDSVTAARLRKNGPECGTAACLAGEVFIRFSPDNSELRINHIGMRCDAFAVSFFAAEFLGLDNHEMDYIFYGGWNGYARSLTSRRQAIRYLEYALKHKNVFVTCRAHDNRKILRKAAINA